MADILEARRVVFNSKVRSKALEGTEGPSAIVGDLLKSMEPEEVSFFYLETFPSTFLFSINVNVCQFSCQTTFRHMRITCVC